MSMAAIGMESMPADIFFGARAPVQVSDRDGVPFQFFSGSEPAVTPRRMSAPKSLHLSVTALTIGSAEASTWRHNDDSRMASAVADRQLLAGRYPVPAGLVHDLWPVW